MPCGWRYPSIGRGSLANKKEPQLDGRAVSVGLSQIFSSESANRSGSMTWVRIVAAGRCIVRSFSPVETVRERVAQEYDVAELAHLCQLRTAGWVPREASIADKPPRPRVAHEERGDDQVQLVRK